MYCKACEQEKGNLHAPWPLPHTCSRFQSYTTNQTDDNVQHTIREFDFEKLARELRKHLNYGDSVRKIAPIVGVSHSTFNRVMNGNPADINTVIRICDWIGLPVTVFIKSSK